MEQTSKARRLFFEGQALHALALGVLLLALFAVSQTRGFHEGSFLGFTSSTWVVLAVGDAIAHQVYVWLCWRSELHGQHLTRRFGKDAFRYYRTGFTILFVLRPVLAFALGYANRGTLPIDPLPGYVAAFVLFLPAVYLMYSVRRYFGFDRAYGIDHFDPSYRGQPLVRKGIFTWTPNAMYVFGFCMMWVPAFLFQSSAALAVAGFSHLYIWVHYVCTERPDMRRIYG